MAINVDVTEPPTPPLRLGELLTSQGLVTEAQLSEALEVQHHFGGRLGTILVELGIVTEEQVAHCLSTHIGMPYRGADAVANIPPEIIARVPKEVARRFRCVPLLADGDTIELGISDHATLADRSALAAAIGADVTLALLTDLTLSYALDRYYGIRRELRGLQLAGVVDAYRWLSDVLSRMSACSTFDDIVGFLNKALPERFASKGTRVLWVEGDSLVIRDHNGTTPFAVGALQLDALRAHPRPQLVEGSLLCPIRDLETCRAVISLDGIKPDYGDVELIQVVLESTAHSISLVEIRANAVKGARLAESLGRYVPGSVVQQLKREQETALYGRKHEVSVMFADIRGFTTLSEHLDPDLTVLMLNIFFAEMSAVIAQFGGTLDKFIGDGLMAFWGAPTAVPDPAARAVQAAQEMHIRMPRVNRKVHRLEIENPNPLTIGIGIGTGVVLVGNLGTRELMQYTAVGDVVNVAARLCGKAQGGETLVDDKTAALVPDVRCAPWGPIVVKGREEPVLVHCITPP